MKLDNNISEIISKIEHYEKPSALFPYDDRDYKIIHQHNTLDGEVIVKQKDDDIQVQYITKDENLHCIDYSNHIVIGLNNQSTDVQLQTLHDIADRHVLSKDPVVSLDEEMRNFRLVVIINYYLFYKKICNMI